MYEHCRTMVLWKYSLERALMRSAILAYWMGSVAPLPIEREAIKVSMSGFS